MRRSITFKALRAALLAAAVALPGTALAQNKVVKLVVAFPPGGPVDIVARLISDPMARELGLAIIVENKPGGNTFIAAEAVARSPADGTVVFLSSMSTMVLDPSLYAPLPYDADKDFAPISLVVSSPTVLVVHPSNPANDATQFAASAKAAAQPVAVGSAGVGGTTHIPIEIFAQVTGAKLLHVPYKGAAPVLSDVMNNQVAAFFGDLPGLIAHVRGGKLKAHGVLAKERHPQLPDVKTMAEQGIANVESGNWYALYAPAKTPPDVIARLNTALHAALADPKARAKLDEIGATVIASTPEEVTRTQKFDAERMGAIIKAKKITVE